MQCKNERQAENKDALSFENKKELSRFVLDLAGFTLDQAGYDSQVYAFFLHVAFRHQTILQGEMWRDICKKFPIHYVPDQALSKEMAAVIAFTQTVVTEVQESAQDNWAIRLIKTSYLSHLDQSRKASEKAIRLLNASRSVDTSFSSMEPQDDYTALLQAHIRYLDALLELPFVMEKGCIALSKNNGYNYQPAKSAQLLAKLIEIADNGTCIRKSLISALKLALEIAMPDLPLDSQVQTAIEDSLLPFIEKLRDRSQTLETLKGAIFFTSSDNSNKPITNARKTLFAKIGVQFQTLQEILQSTLMQPVRKSNELFKKTQDLAEEVYQGAGKENSVDNLVSIGKTFAHFDQIVTQCQSINTSLLPSWMRESMYYYTHMKHSASAITDVTNMIYNGLGAFVDYIASLTFPSVREYFSRTTALKKVLQAGNFHTEKPDEKKLMAFLDFFTLLHACEIQKDDQAILFAAYMQEITKTDTSIDQESDFTYAQYQKLAQQLESKADLLSPSTSLVKRIQAVNPSPSESLKAAMDTNGIQNLEVFGILLLIYRLHTLEHHCKLENALDELIKANSLLSNNPVDKAFRNEFLIPCVQRLFDRYLNAQYVPLLEKMLDNVEDYELTGYADNIKNLYAKLKENKYWQSDEWRCFKLICTHYRNFVKENNEQCTEEKIEKISKIVDLLPEQTKEGPEKIWLTPKALLSAQNQININTAAPVIKNILENINKSLDRQHWECDKLSESANKNSSIKILCQSKIRYILAIKGMIYRLCKDIDNKESSRLAECINAIQNGEAASHVAEHISNQLSVNKLLALASAVWFSDPGSPQAANVDWIQRLLRHYLKDSDFAQVNEARLAFNKALNAHPAPILINELGDPFRQSNMLPTSENIMDTIVGHLQNTVAKSSFSRGINYLALIATQITYDKLIQLLPYPFLAHYAMQAIQSQTLKDQIAHVFKHIMNQYGEELFQRGQDLRKILKNHLYPVLAIPTQDSMEEGAYRYALYLNNKSHKYAEILADRDRFTSFYWRYWAIWNENKERFVSDAAITNLFPQLITNNSNNKKNIIEVFNNAFSEMPDFLNEIHPVEQPRQFLEGLLDNINCENTYHDEFLTTALLKRFLIMTLNSADQLDDPDPSQEQAIETMAKALEILNNPNNNPVKNLRFLNQTKIQLLSEAITRAHAAQLKRVIAELEGVAKKVNDLKNQNEEMIKSPEPLLGISNLEYEYHKSRFSRKLVKAVSISFEIISYLGTWAAIIVPLATSGASAAGVLQTLFIALGISGAVGASASGFGIAALVGVALLRFTYKTGIELWKHRQAFYDLKQHNNKKRLGLGALLVLKCLGLAALKTIFTDYMVAKASTLLAVGPIKRLRNALYVWPSRERVCKEFNKLNDLREKLETLKNSVESQLTCIENNRGDNQKENIEKAVTTLITSFDDARKYLEQKSFNDARELKNHSQKLQTLFKQFEVLQTKIETLRSFNIKRNLLLPANAPQPERQKLPDIAASTNLNNSATRVNMLAYFKQQKEKQIPHSGHFFNLISDFWNWFVTSPSPQANASPQISESKIETMTGLEDWVILCSEPEHSAKNEKGKEVVNPMRISDSNHLLFSNKKTSNNITGPPDNQRSPAACSRENHPTQSL